MKRNDGSLLKNIGPFQKMIPYIMDRRSEAQVFGKGVIYTGKISEYLHEKRRQGHELSYLHFFISSFVRLIAERPELNRFIMNKQIYSRNGIYISMVVKRYLHDDAEETTVKFAFTGKENIFEIAEIVDRKIAECSNDESSDKTYRTAEIIMSMPGFTKTTLVGLLKFMDKHNFLPKDIVEVSPFHTSLFFSYLKSIKSDFVYHHLYDFGTAGIFVAIGKVKKISVVENDAIVIKKCCEIGYTTDERICDGLYFANSLRLLNKYFEDPSLLESTLSEAKEDSGF